VLRLGIIKRGLDLCKSRALASSTVDSPQLVSLAVSHLSSASITALSDLANSNSRSASSLFNHATSDSKDFRLRSSNSNSDTRCLSSAMVGAWSRECPRCWSKSASVSTSCCRAKSESVSTTYYGLQLNQSSDEFLERNTPGCASTEIISKNKVPNRFLNRLGQTFLY
jgi:hypothetical protein